MNPKDMETVCKHYMSKLSPSDLAELDAMLDGGDDPEPKAMDARLPPNVTGKKWLAMDSRTRNAIRSTFDQQAVKRSEAAADFNARFPDAAKVRVI